MLILNNNMLILIIKIKKITEGFNNEGRSPRQMHQVDFTLNVREEGVENLLPLRFYSGGVKYERFS